MTNNNEYYKALHNSSRFQSSNDRLLRSRIRLLSTLLGSVLKEQEGDKVFNSVELLRKGFISLKKKENPKKRQSLKRFIYNMDIAVLERVIRAFSIYFGLSNVAEEKYKNYAWTRNKIKGIPNSGSFKETLTHLKNQGATAEKIQLLLNQMLFRPVLTAHPTEAKRRTLMQHMRKVFLTLKDLDQSRHRDTRVELVKKLRRLIQILWKTNEVRLSKPTIEAEVINGLYYFNNSIFQAIPKLYRTLETVLDEIYPGNHISVPNFIEFGSWIGGDRDGNHYVTPRVTQRTWQLQSIVILEEYIKRLDSLINELTHSNMLVEVSENFIIKYEHSRRMTQQTVCPSVQKFMKEPYRRHLTFMRHRIECRLKTLQRQVSGKYAALPDMAYKFEYEFLDDLKLIDDSLRQHNDAEIADQELKDLIRLAETFGFHLVRLDLRDESIKHSQAIAAILGQWGQTNRYLALDEKEKTVLLTELLLSEKLPTLDRKILSKEVAKTIQVFDIIKRAHHNIGLKSVGNYVISMTHTVNHILEVMVLGKIAGLIGKDEKDNIFCHLSPSPLFETIEDLKHLEQVMEQLLSNKAYMPLLKASGNLQEIMVGYSDSCKDGGIFASAWNLYEVQADIVRIASRHQVQCRIFHGRGGTIGRGGGPSHKAIIAQPPGTVCGQIKVTEQGEVLSSKYANPETTVQELTLTTSGLMFASRHLVLPPQKDDPINTQIAQDLSSYGEEFYRNLVDDTPGLFDYFYSATPVVEIGEMNIGSRPSHRKMADKSKTSIRAIPWVFGWSLSRHTLPAWYGVGYALERYHNNDPEQLKKLQTLYQSWPFFQMLINNTQLALLKANMNIAEEYAQLCTKKRLADKIFNKIRDEYERTTRYVLQVGNADTLPEEDASLMISLMRRDPYLDPLNYMQVMLLKKYRENKKMRGKNTPAEDTDYLAPLLHSINAIATGMRNTG